MRSHKLSLLLIILAGLLGLLWMKIDQQIKYESNRVWPVLTERPKSLKEEEKWNEKNPFLFVTGEYPPFVYTENGKLKGLTADLVVAVLDDMKIPYKIQVESWSKCEHLMQTGDAFGTFPYSKTPGRAAAFVFSDCIYKAGDMADYAYVYQPEGMAKAKINLDQPEDLKPYKVAGVIGYYYFEQLKALGVDIEVCQTEQEAMDKLKLGRVDVMLLNRTMASYLFKGLPEAERSHYIKTQVKFEANDEGDYMMLDAQSPQTSGFVKRFNETLKAFETDGRAAKIRAPYLGALDTSE